MPVNVIQFSVPGLAAEAVNVRQLEASARRAGVGVVRLSYHFVYRESKDGNGYRCRVMCSVEMAVFLIEQLRLRESHAMERGQDDIAAACSRGMRETYVALMAPPSPARRRSTKRGNASRGGSNGGNDGGTHP
jgi:hypothetical protein